MRPLFLLCKKAASLLAVFALVFTSIGTLPFQQLASVQPAHAATTAPVTFDPQTGVLTFTPAQSEPGFFQRGGILKQQSWTPDIPTMLQGNGCPNAEDACTFVGDIDNGAATTSTQSTNTIDFSGVTQDSGGNALQEGVNYEACIFTVDSGNSFGDSTLDCDTTNLFTFTAPATGVSNVTATGDSTSSIDVGFTVPGQAEDGFTARGVLFFPQSAYTNPPSATDIDNDNACGPSNDDECNPAGSLINESGTNNVTINSNLVDADGNNLSNGTQYHACVLTIATAVTLDCAASLATFSTPYSVSNITASGATDAIQVRYNVAGSNPSGFTGRDVYFFPTPKYSLPLTLLDLTSCGAGSEACNTVDVDEGQAGEIDFSNGDDADETAISDSTDYIICIITGAGLSSQLDCAQNTFSPDAPGGNTGVSDVSASGDATSSIDVGFTVPGQEEDGFQNREVFFFSQTSYTNPPSATDINNDNACGQSNDAACSRAGNAIDQSGTNNFTINSNLVDADGANLVNGTQYHACVMTNATAVTLNCAPSLITFTLAATPGVSDVTASGDATSSIDVGFTVPGQAEDGFSDREVFFFPQSAYTNPPSANDIDNENACGQSNDGPCEPAGSTITQSGTNNVTITSELTDADNNALANGTQYHACVITYANATTLNCAASLVTFTAAGNNNNNSGPTNGSYTVITDPNSNSIESGASITLTITPYDSDDNAITSSVDGFIEFARPPDQNNPFPGDCTLFDITAVGGNIALRDNASINGNDDDRIPVTFTGAGTVTAVASTTGSGNCAIFAGIQGGSPNPPDTGDFTDNGDTPGSDVQLISIAFATTGAELLRVVPEVTSTAAFGRFEVEIQQENSNGAVIASTLTDVGISISGDGASIVAVNGTDITPTTSLTDQSLGTIGSIEIEIQAGAEGNNVTITPSSATLTGTDVPATVTIGAAGNSQLRGYGPPSGEATVHPRDPVDFMFDFDISETISNFDATTDITNGASSVFRITSSQGPVSGIWTFGTDNFGFTAYGARFIPDAQFLPEGTELTVSVLKAIGPGGSNFTVSLPSGGNFQLPDLDDAGDRFEFDFTTTNLDTANTGISGPGTGTSGGGGGEGRDMFIELIEPGPGRRFNVPEGLEAMIIEVGQSIRTTSVNSQTILLQRRNGAAFETVSETLNFDVDEGGRIITITGHSLSSGNEYRLVIVKGGIQSQRGDTFPGVPVDANGEPLQNFGGGGSDRTGDLPFIFNVGADREINASFVGWDLSNTTSNGTVEAATDVSPIRPLHIFLNGPINPRSLEGNVVLRKFGTSQVAITYEYFSDHHEIEVRPSGTGLETSTDYTLTISDITTPTGASVTDFSGTFTTASSATATAIEVIETIIDNGGIHIRLNQPIPETSVLDKSNYALYVCPANVSATNTTTCGDASTPEAPSLLSSDVVYEDAQNMIHITGFSRLTTNAGYILSVSGLTDFGGNTMTATEINGLVYNQDIFAGGGAGAAGNLDKGDLDRENHGMMPVAIHPQWNIAGQTSNYFIDGVFDVAIPAGGVIAIELGPEFGVSNVTEASFAPPNTFHDPDIDTEISSSTDPSFSGTATNGTDNDGISINANTGTVYIALDNTTEIRAGVPFSFALSGVVNTSQISTVNSSGVQGNIDLYSSVGQLLQSTVPFPRYYRQSGTSTVSGKVTDGNGNLEGATVMFHCDGMGETTTTTDANGDYSFASLPDESNCEVGLFEEFTISGTRYLGGPPRVFDISGSNVENVDLTAAAIDAGSSATVSVRVTWPGLNEINNLGFEDTVHIGASQTGSQTKTVVTRTQLENHIADPVTNPISLLLPGTGVWNVWVRPGIPDQVEHFPFFDWMEPPPVQVNVTTSDIGGTITAPVLLQVEEVLNPTQQLTVNVVDEEGTAIPQAKVILVNVFDQRRSPTVADELGSAQPPLNPGEFRLFAKKEGMGRSIEKFIFIDPQGNVFSDGGQTNTITLAIEARRGRAITGNISRNGTGAQGIFVHAFRTDGPGQAEDFTDNNGDYELYVGGAADEAQEWDVFISTDIYFEQQSITVAANEGRSDVNFEIVETGLGTITGTVTGPNGGETGADIHFFGNGWHGHTVTDSTGSYSKDLPAGTYDIEAVIGDFRLPLLTNVTVTAGQSNANNDFNSTATQREVTIVMQDTNGDPFTFDHPAGFVLEGASGQGRIVLFMPENISTITENVPEASYNFKFDLPGMPRDLITITGAEFNNNVVDIDDGTDGSDNTITVTMPAVAMVTITVEDSQNNPVRGAKIDFIDPDNNEKLTEQTDSNGQFIQVVPIGLTFSVMARSNGRRAQPVDVSVSGNTAVTLTLPAIATTTVSGTLSDSNGDGVAGKVILDGPFGGHKEVPTDADGTYSVRWSGPLEIFAQAREKENSTVTRLFVDENKTGVDFTLTNLTSTTLATPAVISGDLSDALSTTIDNVGGFSATQNAIGQGTGAVQIEETNVVSSTDTANVIGDTALDITVTDANADEITLFEGVAEITIVNTAAELSAQGVTTLAELEGVSNAYHDGTDWSTLATTSTVLKDTNGNTVTEATVGTGTLAAAGVTTVEIKSLTTHATVFASTVPQGATPPATPTTVAATAGDTQNVVTWDANTETDIDNYRVWEANVAENIVATVSHATACTGGTCTYTHTSLTNGTEYAYQIIAVDTEGNQSAGSTVATATPATNNTNNTTSSGGTRRNTSSSGGGGGASFYSLGGGSTSTTTSNTNTTTSTTRETRTTDVQTNLSASTLSSVVNNGKILRSSASATTTPTVLTGQSDVRVLDLAGKNIEVFSGATELKGTGTTAPFLTADKALSVTKIEFSSGATDWDGKIMKPAVVSRSAVTPPTNVSTSSKVTIIQAGAENAVSLVLSEEVTITGPAPEGSTSSTSFTLYHSADGTNWIEAPNATVTLSGETVSFTTDHLTYFMVVAEPAPATTTTTADRVIAPPPTTTGGDDTGLVVVPDSFTPTSDLEAAAQSKIDVEYASDSIGSHGWSKPYVEKVVEFGIAEGYNDDKFHPERQLNRAEFVKMVVETFLIPVETPRVDPFSDVDKEAWYAPYVAAAVQHGFIQGYPDGTFQGDRPLNRAEAMVIIARAAEFETDNVITSITFTDLTGDWYRDAVYYAAKYNIVKGIGNGRFAPTDIVTRGQMAKMLINTLYHLQEL